MRYRATLDNREIGKGSFQDVQMAVMGVVTDALAENPEGVAKAAQEANSTFEDGFLNYFIDRDGAWRMDLAGKLLKVTREEV